MLSVRGEQGGVGGEKRGWERKWSKRRGREGEGRGIELYGGKGGEDERTVEGERKRSRENKRDV